MKQIVLTVLKGVFIKLLFLFSTPIQEREKYLK